MSFEDKLISRRDVVTHLGATVAGVAVVPLFRRQTLKRRSDPQQHHLLIRRPAQWT
jgi:hypothetical protein